MQAGRVAALLHLSVAGLLFGALSACRDSPGPADRVDSLPRPAGTLVKDVAGQVGGTLRYALAGQPQTFNPVAAQDTRSKLLTFLTSATLLYLDPVTQEVEGGLAQSWERSSDGLVFKLELREGVRFSDGEPVTTSDVVFTFQRLLEEGSRNALQASLIINEEKVSVRALSPTELEVHFPVATPSAEYILASIPVLPQHRLGDHEGPIESAWTLDTPEEEIVGLGPFRLVEHLAGRRTRLRFNPHYWIVDSEGLRLPYLDEISIEYVDDPNSQVLRLQAGEIDLLDRLLRPEDIELLKASGTETVTLDAGASGNLAFLWFNLSTATDPENGEPFVSPERQKWFGDPTFRRAIAAAIDRDSIVQNVFLGAATPAVSFVAPTNRFWFEPAIDGVKYDLQRARRLLVEAGFRSDRREGLLVDSDGNFVEFRLVTLSNEVSGRTAAIIQQDLAQLGIRVSIIQEELGSVVSRITRSRDYEAVLMNLDFTPDPSDYVDVFASNGSLHVWDPRQTQPKTAWESRLDELMQLQMSALDYQRRFELFGEAQRIIAQQQPVIPLVNRNILVAHRKEVKNVGVANIFPYAFAAAAEICFEPH